MEVIRNILNSYNKDNNVKQNIESEDELQEEIKIKPPVPNDNIVNKI